MHSADFQRFIEQFKSLKNDVKAEVIVTLTQYCSSDVGAMILGPNAVYATSEKKSKELKDKTKLEETIRSPQYSIVDMIQSSAEEDSSEERREAHREDVEERYLRGIYEEGSPEWEVANYQEYQSDEETVSPAILTCSVRISLPEVTEDVQITIHIAKDVTNTFYVLAKNANTGEFLRRISKRDIDGQLSGKYEFIDATSIPLGWIYDAMDAMVDEGIVAPPTKTITVGQVEGVRVFEIIDEKTKKMIDDTLSSPQDGEKPCDCQPCETHYRTGELTQCRREAKEDRKLFKENKVAFLAWVYKHNSDELIQLIKTFGSEIRNTLGKRDFTGYDYDQVERYLLPNFIKYLVESQLRAYLRELCNEDYDDWDLEDPRWIALLEDAHKVGFSIDLSLYTGEHGYWLKREVCDCRCDEELGAGFHVCDIVDDDGCGGKYCEVIMNDEKRKEMQEEIEEQKLDLARTFASEFIGLIEKAKSVLWRIYQ